MSRDLERSRRRGWTARCLVRTVSVLSLAAAIGACSSSPPRLLMSADEWSRALASRGVETRGLVDPLDWDAELRRTALEVAGKGSDLEKLRRLQDFLFDEERFVFDYQSRQTQTALEAFASRSGNCVSFTNLFVALGRAAGVPVQAALAWRSGAMETIGDLALLNSHVVAAYRHGGRRAVYDFDRRQEEKVVGYEPIDDLLLNAIYLNNRGVEKLIEGDSAAAERFFTDAIRLDPVFHQAYNNLGVALQRSGQTASALDAFLLALQIEPAPETRRNLLGMYAQMARDRRLADSRVEGEPESQVETLLAEGDEALSQSRLKAAVEAYGRALEADPSHPGPHVALARTLLFHGRVKAAKKRLRRALELDPTQPEARRLLEGLSHELRRR